ncbi:MAG TPA: DUF3048 domain-containing protein [Patescibacteria group bacterium]|nr:DUF3048 domain-containing protein [Patescibacteria group bacterium]
MNNKKLTIALISIMLFVASAFASYAVFSNSPLTKKAIPVSLPKVSSNGTVVFDNSLPKTQACPINGVLYSTQQEAWWKLHRPLGVMIENSTDARPQSGISFADVTYEAMAEGGITRFLNIYYCQDAPEVGPVRSARTVFVNLVSEYGSNPLYAHVGGANTSGPADALGQISDYGWDSYNDLNQFSIGFPTYWRDYTRLGHDVATEHTMYSTTTKLWDFAKANRNLTNVDKDGKAWDTNFVPYTFADDAPASQRPSSQSVHMEFGNGGSDYFVDWTYDPKTNLYMRANGGKSHIDLDTKKQLSAKDVVVLFESISNVDDGYENSLHLLYGDKGTGKAVVFMNGKETKGTWKKISRTSRTQLFDANGSPIAFTRGKLWFDILPLNGVLTVK